MFRIGSSEPETAENLWRRQLAQFVKDNQKDLAALAWGLWLERQNKEEALGIDLKPVPHFVYCPKKAVEELNQKVNKHLQEILGVLDNHNPEKEVLIIGIGEGQLKLIQFETEPAPPVCFEQVGADVNTLLDRLEQRLAQQVNALINPSSVQGDRA